MKKLITDIRMMAMLMVINLQLFNNTNVTGDSGMTIEMKTFYDMNLLRIARAKLVHNDFGQKKPIPKGKGKVIEFRRYTPFPKALTPLTEGVTPNGRKMTLTNVTCTVNQYGDYVEISDMLDLTAIDDNLVQAGKLLGPQAGETLDTITREIINAGTNVQYACGSKAARYLLVGGDGVWANNDYINVECIRQAARNLRNNKTNGIEGGNEFAAIAHVDSIYTIKKDSEWTEANKYTNPTPLFTGQVGKYDGVNFKETTEAKVFHAADLSATRNLTCASLSGKIFTIAEALTAPQAAAMVGRKIIVKGYLYTVTASAAGSAGTATVTVAETVQGAPTTDVMYPGEAGKDGRDVYSTLVIGSDAYGVVDVEGGGLEMIVKQLGSGGTSDPLNQRATSGWKAIHTAIILQDVFMVRIEHTTPYQAGAN